MELESSNEGDMSEEMLRRKHLPRVSAELLRLFVLIPVICLTFFASALLPALNAQEVQLTEPRIGFEGSFKLGFWTEVSATVESDEDLSGYLEVVVPDGEGADLVYRLPTDDTPIQLKANSPQRIRGLVRVGRLNSLLQFRWVDENGETIGNPLRFDTSEGGLTSVDELIVGVGKHDFFEGVMPRLRAEGRELRQLELDDCSQFPEMWAAWEAVDSLILTTDQVDVFDGLNEQQIVALEQWLLMGGQIYLSLSENASDLLSNDGWLKRILPGNFESFVAHDQSTGFESYAQASEQLLVQRNATIALAKISNVDGIVEAYEGRSERELPLVVRAPRGFGRIILVTFDLNNETFIDWQGRDRFVVNVFRPEGPRAESGIRERGTGKVTHIGYTDLAGQLRSAMDQFEDVYFVSFTWIAVLVVLFIACIGPLDYFLLRKLLRRMELTWITFPFFLILFSAIAIYTLKLTKVNEIRVNQIEIVDIDETSGMSRGIVWETIYSPRSSRYDLKFETDKANSSIEVDDKLFTWQGLPGSGLGGMDTSLKTAVGINEYSSLVTSESIGEDTTAKTDESAADQINGDSRKLDWGDALSVSLEGAPVPVASTKTFVGRWNGAVSKSIISELELDRRSDSLSGTITNTLDVDLTNVVILYGTWAYEVEKDVPAGGQFRIGSGTREKTLEGYLKRRQVIDGRDVTSPWSPTSRDLRRILEMYSFHEEVGGSAYTGLTQRLHPYLDISRQLTTDRAVMLGRAKAPYSSIRINGEDVADKVDQQLTLYRIILPVKDPFEREEQ